MIVGVHHLKVPVRDLGDALTWWQTVLGAEHLARFDHVDEEGRLYAVIIDVPGAGVPIELRLAPAAAGATAGYDPVTFAVADRAGLERLTERLDELNVHHSGLIVGYIGSVVDVPTPDGLRLRFYANTDTTLESSVMRPDAADIHNPALSPQIMESFPSRVGP